eukprot:TRINITY_DN1426_c0_g1_i1.p1 TRINITY_DN1426_c0_g1~~TRINITY_DN1426_c0_g1_i1.p1  ORF type:complete len:358 (-),score=61.83 TRINITY_DN1426_c0_g1_i1:884-1957(-)
MNNLLLLISTKLLCIILLWTITIIFVCAPTLIVKKFSTESSLFSFINCCSGGIFLSTAIIHLLGESTAQFEELSIKYYDIPFSIIFFSIGFFVMLLIEKILVKDLLRYSKTLKKKGEIMKKNDFEDEENVSNDEKEVEIDTFDKFNRMIKIKRERSNSVKKEDEERKKIEEDLEEEIEESEDDIMDDEHIAQVILSEEDNVQSKMTGFLLTLILSIHSIMIGIVIGIQQYVPDTISLFVGIALHKWVESLILGTSLIRSSLSQKSRAKISLLYSIMIPIGIVIGMLLLIIMSGDSLDWVVATFSGIAGGSFLYISLVDIILEELQRKGNPYIKFTGCVLSFMVMTLYFQISEILHLD